MPILKIKTQNIGEAGQEPSIIYIVTDDTQAQVVVPGYLNKAAAQGITFSEFQMALVATKEDSISPIQTAFYNVLQGPDGYSLVLASGSGEFETIKVNSIELLNAEGNFIVINPPATGLTDTTYTLPTSATPGVLTTDIDGNLSWQSVGGVGTVTSISAGAGITCTPDPITSSGVVSLSSTPVTAASYSYGNGGFTVDGQGRLTAASSATNIVTSVTAGTGLTSSGPSTSPTLSLNSSVVSSVTTNAVGTTFSANIASNLLTISLPDASLSARGLVNTGGQNFKGTKNLLGTFTITNDGSTSTSLLNITNNYSAGDCVVSTFYAPYLLNQSSVFFNFGFEASLNNESITSFTKIATNSVYNYHLVTLNGQSFGVHTTSNSIKFGPTGTGDSRGLGRTGVDGFDTIYPAYEFSSENPSTFPFLNLSSNVYPYGNTVSTQTYSTYHMDITDGVHAAAAIYATADNVNSGSLYGSLWLTANTGGSLSALLQLRNDGAIMTPKMSTVDPMGTLAGYDQACLAYQYKWEPNATLGPFVTGADKFSSWWQRVGNVVTCYVKWKVSVDSVNAGDMIQWYCDLPSNITGISLANTDDVCGHVTFFKTPCFNSGTVIAEDSQHVQFSVMCLQSVISDTYQVTSSWSYVINA